MGKYTLFGKTPLELAEGIAGMPRFELAEFWVELALCNREVPDDRYALLVVRSVKGTILHDVPKVGHVAEAVLR